MMKNKVTLTFGFLVFTVFSFAQTAQHKFNSNSLDNIVMTWNATTPEQEMKDDINALADHGVSITYSNVKRNDKKEITAITVSYEATTGEKGSLSYNQQKPIPTIKIYKLGDTVGFGEPNDSQSNYNFANLLEGLEVDDIPGLRIEFNSENTDEYKNKKGSKVVTIVERSDREKLVIENGEIVEGGADYSIAELDEIKKDHKESLSGDSGFKQFNYKGNQDFSEQLNQIQKQLDELKESQEKANENSTEQSKDKTEKSKSSLKIKKA
jgi:hypothetical protein